MTANVTEVGLNPYSELVSRISPMEFEIFCFDVIKAYAEADGLKNFSIVHDKKIKTHDGEYQIDIYAEFTAVLVTFKIIFECKRYSRSVEREKIVILADKIRSLGINKGVLISTSGFQSGAIEYAKAHGIGLLQIIDKHIFTIRASISYERPEHVEFIRQSPPYFAYQYSGIHHFPNKKIYPTIYMDTKLKEKIMMQYQLPKGNQP